MIILITGASTGIGRALASRYAEEGHALILMARSLDLLTELKHSLTQKFPASSILICQSDVSNIKKHVQDINFAVEAMGGLDLVIANAGIGLTTIETANCLEKNIEIFSVNVLGAIATIETAKDYFLKQGHGHVVGITSVAAARGMPTSAAYCASKTALATFLEGLRVDLSETKIQVTAIHPGFVDTPLTAKNGKMFWLQTADRSAELIARAVARHRKRYVFPWQMKIVFGVLQVMPDGLYDFIFNRLNGWAKRFKQHRD